MFEDFFNLYNKETAFIGRNCNKMSYLIKTKVTSRYNSGQVLDNGQKEGKRKFSLEKNNDAKND